MHLLIVDDEPLARDELTYLIHQISKDIQVSQAETGQEALDIISDEEVEVDGVFLDIQLSVENGMSIADDINALPNPPAIIFATAYDAYAVAAFERDALDYVLKPFSLDRIQHSINKLANQVEQKLKVKRPDSDKEAGRTKRFPLEAGDKLVIVDSKDILAVEVLKGQTTLYTRDGKYSDRQSLVKWEEKLSQDSFIRVHRSYLIQLDAIKEIQAWFNQTYQVTLENGMKIPVSRSYLQDFKEALGLN